MITDPFPTDAIGIDPADIDHYADRLHEAAHGPDCDCRPQIRRQYHTYVRALVVWLAADGRLTNTRQP